MGKLSLLTFSASENIFKKDVWRSYDKRKPQPRRTFLEKNLCIINYPNAYHFSEQKHDWVYSAEYFQKLVEAKNRLKAFLEQKQVQSIRAKYKEAYLQTCYSCEVHYSISKKCWIGSACIHGNVLECIIGKSFSEVLEKISIANENYATSMSSLLSV